MRENTLIEYSEIALNQSSEAALSNRNLNPSDYHWMNFFLTKNDGFSLVVRSILSTRRLASGSKDKSGSDG